MIACRSPPAFFPPSIGVFPSKGYGPLSLSLAYVKWTRTFGCDPATVVYGIPYGKPPEGPKSGWRFVLDALIDRSQAALWLFTGRRETSACQTLFAGKTRHFGAPGGGTAPAPPAGASTAATDASTEMAATLRIVSSIGDEAAES